MSGIVGLFRPSGKPVEPAELEGMLDTLVHRGSDGSGLWNSGAVGLGHRMLWTTTESLQEKLPLVSAGEDLAITSDARLDNRDELIRALGLADRPAAQITESELILAAYERWGEACPEKLLGDFAFAIWDGRKQKLLCARDHFGVKLLYYHHSSRLFAFGTELKAILSLPEVPRELNEVRLAEYLVRVFEDKVGTFYRDMFRLPPAHVLTVDREGMRLRNYWSLQAGRELRLGSEEEYAEGFREVFAEAVKCRLRSAFPVGAMLSGGLDSSAISVVAARQLRAEARGRLHTFSGVFPSMVGVDQRVDESEYMQSVLATEEFDHHRVRVDRVSPLEGVRWDTDEPIPAPNLYMDKELFTAVRDHQNRVVLSGWDGDSTVSNGFEYLPHLIRSGRWREVVRETRAVAHRYRRPTRVFMREFGFRPLVPDSARLAWRAVRGRSTDPWSADTAINPEFARRLGLARRIRALGNTYWSPLRSARQAHLACLRSGLLVYGLELLDKCAGVCSVEARYPFCDRRLLEFCLSVPPELKLHEGWPRWIMRRAMDGILPDDVRWRVFKGNLGPNFRQRLQNDEKETIERAIGHESERLAAYMDLPALKAAYERFSEQPIQHDSESLTVFLAVTLSLWLGQHGAKTEIAAPVSRLADIRIPTMERR